MQSSASTRHFVICLLGAGESEDGNEEYVLATRQVWTDKEKAVKYAASVSPSRKPIVVTSYLGLDFREVV